MRASNILRKLWLPITTEIDSRRMLALLLAIDAVVSTACVTLSSIGRALSARTTPKHSIKRIDRLLANRHLQRDLPLMKQALAKRLLRRERRPVILVDWSVIRGRWWVLCASLPHLGRSLPLHYEVHPKSRVGNRRVQSRFLAQLATILPADSRPIIVADAGFKTPFFLSCDEHRFDFVIRLRGRGSLYRYRECSISFADVFAQAGPCARALGRYQLYRNAVHLCERHVVLGARPMTRRGSDYQRRRAAEPWLLATSLRDHTPTQIVSIYALRMQIEETFRDAKNPRFGWALSYSRSDSRARLLVLVALASFALIAAILVGAAAEYLGLHRGLQANSIRNRRVLSLFAVGAWMILTPSPKITLRLVINRIAVIHELLRTTRRARPHQLKLPFSHEFFSRR